MRSGDQPTGSRVSGRPGALYDRFVEFVAKDRGSQSYTIRRALREYIRKRVDSESDR